MDNKAINALYNKKGMQKNRKIVSKKDRKADGSDYVLTQEEEE